MTVTNSVSGDLRFRLSRTFAHWRGDLAGGLTIAVLVPLALEFAVASGVELEVIGVTELAVLHTTALFLFDCSRVALSLTRSH